jgi:hypothetical protein
VRLLSRAYILTPKVLALLGVIILNKVGVLKVRKETRKERLSCKWIVINREFELISSKGAKGGNVNAAILRHLATTAMSEI